MSITGQADGAPGAEPMKVGVAVADLFTGMYAVTGILAALRHAERTGQGQHLDVCLLDAQIAMLANQAMNYFVSGQSPTRLGNAHPNIAPYQVFETADGHLVLAVGNDGQFRSFCTAAGLSDVSADPRFATNKDRVAHRSALTGAIAPAMRRDTTAGWISRLESAGVPCGPINTIGEVFTDPHVQARHVRQTMTRSDGIEVALVASPLRLSQTPPRADHAPPPLGADTDKILTARLNLDAAAIANLRAQGAI
jgi:crotonobetainyl-CoA:carnitine CoA-transferase CaiB-like acyl-CoA transferase